MSRKAPPNAAAVAAETAGRALGAFFRLIKAARPVRPIHPEGVALHGELIRTGSPAGLSGVTWLDIPGTDTVQARFSRSAGLPKRLPDILGLALRVTPSPQLPGPDLPEAGEPEAGPNGGGRHGAGDAAEAEAFADVLFSSTGWRLPGRFLLKLKHDAASAAFTTLMPYKGVNGPVILGLRTTSSPPGSFKAGALAAGPLTDADWVLELHWAKPTGAWRPCGELRLRAPPDPQDTPLRFNPLENQPPGARTYPWTRRLRERSYRVAQQPAPPPS